MSWENDLKTTLRELDVPGHGPRFWSDLESRLNEVESPDRVGVSLPRFRWKAPVGIAAAAAAVMVALTLPTSLTPSVLAYAFPEGTFSYAVEHDEAHTTQIDGEGQITAGAPVSTEAEGTLTYTVDDGPEAGTMEIGVQADVSSVNIECGETDCADDETLFQDIPELRFVVETDGELVEYLPTGADDAIPALVLPDPLPGSDITVGMPFGFGPPFPERALEIGDTWTTEGARSAFADGGPMFTAQHEVVGEETMAGRDTVVIESVYQTEATEVTDRTGDTADAPVSEMTYGPEAVQTTVWFDPAAGIIVRAELHRTTTAVTEYENGQTGTSTGTTQMLVELISED